MTCADIKWSNSANLFWRLEIQTSNILLSTLSAVKGAIKYVRQIASATACTHIKFDYDRNISFWAPGRRIYCVHLLIPTAGCGKDKIRFGLC
jgi:hypothetical protein